VDPQVHRDRLVLKVLQVPKVILERPVLKALRVYRVNKVQRDLRAL
jgi:hypothetical protein